jgi:sugar/nucleoside kinase (ribokinase family)
VRWRGEAAFVGLTPQGLTRTWPAAGGHIRQISLDPSRVPARWDAVVLGAQERASCAWLLTAAGDASGAPRPARCGGHRADARDPLVAVTAEGAATEIYAGGKAIGAVPVRPIARVVDDLGAGDVFAAAFFAALHRGDDPVQAARLGHAAAAVRIGAAGPRAVGRRDAVEARLRAGT